MEIHGPVKASVEFLWKLQGNLVENPVPQYGI